MSKVSTKNGKSKLAPEIAHLVRGIRDGQAQIAAAGKIDKAYVSRVVNGHKPPSTRFLLALDCVLGGLQSRVCRAILHHEHPELLTPQQGGIRGKGKKQTNSRRSPRRS